MASIHNTLRRIWPFTLLLGGLLLIALTFLDYGITWDETPLATYGELVASYFQSGFRDRSCNSFIDSKYYGPIFELTAATLSNVAGGWRYEIRHFLIALTALLAVVGVMRFAGLFRDRNLVLLAPLALVMLPRFYGHSFNNSKDIPFACAFAWAMYAIALLFHGKQFTWRHTLFAGLAIGTALATRAGGMLLFFYLAVLTVVSCATGRMRSGTGPSNRVPSLLNVKILVRHGVVIVLVAWTLMVSFWPWAHENPLLNPIRAFLMQNDFHASYPFLFEGRVVMSDQLPWYYLPKFILITTPPFLLFLFLFAIPSSVYEQYKDYRAPDSFLYFVIQLWFFFPVIYVIITKPNIYDGIRHFLFILPALALMAAIGASALLKQVAPRFRPIAWGLLLIAVLVNINTYARLHPYQMTYFNFLAGGMEEAGKNYETDYWTASYKEAMEWINERSGGKTTRVLLAANEYNRIGAEYFKGQHIETTTLFSQVPDPVLDPYFDYYLATTRYGLDQNFPANPIVHVVGREGAVFTVIRGRLQ